LPVLLLGLLAPAGGGYGCARLGHGLPIWKLTRVTILQAGRGGKPEACPAPCWSASGTHNNVRPAEGASRRMSSVQSVASRALATGGLVIGTMMNSMDSTIANVALPHIQGSLSASQDQITWVLTSYIVATAIMTPFSGWLAMRIGRRPMFLASIAAFVASS